MKNIKKVVLLVVSMFLLTSLLPSLTVFASDAKASSKDEPVVYEAITDLPSILPDAEIIKFRPDHPAYMAEGRNKLLGQVVAKSPECLITFSIPEIEGLDNLDIEDYNFMAPEAQAKRILMVTSEYYSAKKGDKIARTSLFVFNPSEKPEVTLEFEDDVILVSMDPVVAEIDLSAVIAKTTKLWTDDYTKASTKASTYQSTAASMWNYAKHGWSASQVDDALFSYDFLDLPYDMRKCLTEYLYDYNEYLSKEAKKESWYQAKGKYWQKKDYSSFDLDQYAKSLGATVQNSPSEKGDKEYLIGDHTIYVGCFTKPEEWANLKGQDHTVDVGLDCSWVYWTEHGARNQETTYNFNTYAYEQREGEWLSPVKIDDYHYVSRWDFDFIVSLLEYCAKIT